jgi:hypothetical protein
VTSKRPHKASAKKAAPGKAPVKPNAKKPAPAKPGKPAAAAPAAKKPLPKMPVKRTQANYGMAVSGKLGSRKDLEEEYVRKFIAVDPKDGILSLREAVQQAYKDGKRSDDGWARVQAVQKSLEAIKDKLLAAGYTMADLMKLTLDNS